MFHEAFFRMKKNNVCPLDDAPEQQKHASNSEKSTKTERPEQIEKFCSYLQQRKKLF